MLFPLVLAALGTVVAVVVLWQMFATRRARAVLAREDEYRQLAERAVTAQEGAERRLGEITARLADMHVRLESLERVLTTVE
jgi:hypothetical protein